MTVFEKLVGLLKNHCAVIGETNCMAAIGKKCTMEGCAKCLAGHLLAHGVTVKEPQKPLTVEDVSDDEVWLDEKFSWTDPVRVEASEFCGYAEIYRIGHEKPEYKNYETYGKTWRCWAEKPTEEERKDAEWED